MAKQTAIQALTVLLVTICAFSAQGATTFTGDKIQGVPVITQLSVDDFEPGKTPEGRVAIIGTDAIRERNVDIVTILTNSTKCPAEGCPYHGDEP